MYTYSSRVLYFVANKLQGDIELRACWLVDFAVSTLRSCLLSLVASLLLLLYTGESVAASCPVFSLLCMDGTKPRLDRYIRADSQSLEAVGTVLWKM